ncbi:MAG: 50S ribosomal protein L13 [Nanoarchaeota archaeon]
MNKEKIVIDGTNSSLGRLASYAAKQALLGREIVILNCDSVALTGRKRMIIEEYKYVVTLGGYAQKGPYYRKRNSERLVKRTIRGMLNYKQGRGLAAFKRIMCYNLVPKEYESVKAIKIESKAVKTMTMKELTKEL